MTMDIQPSVVGPSQEVAAGKYGWKEMRAHKKQLLFEFDDKVEKDR